MPNSRPKAKRPLRYAALALLAGCAPLALSPAAHADEDGKQTTQEQERHIVLPKPSSSGTEPQARINPTGKPVTLTVAAKDGPVYLGDIVVTIQPDDSIEFSSRRLMDLLSNVLDPDVLRNLQASFAGKTAIGPESFQASGIQLRYDPQQLAIAMDIASERRATRTVMVSPLERDKIGTYVKPAEFSAYLNIRGNVDYLWSGADKGLQSPVLFLDGAARALGAVIESQAVWQPGSNATDFQRLGTRLVYDDPKNLVRWTLGDLQPVTRGFQSVPDIAGLSVFRSYSVLQPQEIVRPRGDRSFQLTRSSTVEVFVNGELVRRLQLAPGTYNLRDFPFTQGANDVRLNILDDTGRSEVLRFNVFLDQSQLSAGLSEFGLYAGVMAPLEAHGPNYSSKPAVSAFIRHGMSDALTLGANVQADSRVVMGGVEAVWGTSLGTFSGSFSYSHIDGIGHGRAALATFQRLIQRPNGRSDSITLFFESRSRDFGPIGTVIPRNPFVWEAGGGYSHTFTDYLYGGIDGRYSRGRGLQRDLYTARATMGWRINDRLTMTGDLRYERDNIRSGLGGLVSLTLRLGRYSNLRADYDTRTERARLSYNMMHGQGVGSYNLAADIERDRNGAGISAAGNYVSNRADLGFSHFGTFDDDFGRSTGQRTSFRFGTAIAVADGALTIGRPIYDSFAVVKGHESLKGANIRLDPTEFGYVASTGALGTGLQPSLSSYAERTVKIDVPNAPAGYDLGQGAYRLFPPYRSGYRLDVGSGYNLTAMGRMTDRNGDPVALVTGTATELAHPEREPIPVFTNREGRFAATGLAAGRWRIDMLDTEKSSYTIDIAESAEGVVRLGELTPAAKDGTKQ